jgi:glycosyltransferase involved in cell wall biosynthesis
VQISLIITTYNWPQALDLVLASVARQSRMPDEVIIADDGSGEETARLVASWRARLGVPLHHVWQENRGFRAGRSRNRGIAAARGDYVILLDGDMILHERFVADHEAAAEPRWFVQGQRIPTSPGGAQWMLRNPSAPVNFFTPGLRRRHQAVRSRVLSRLFSRRSVPMTRVKSCNEGCWRADLIAVNGFEEHMIGWGPEDKECVARLLHLGIRGKELRFAALAAHLYHPVRSPQGANPNDALLTATLESRRTRCQLGLDQHLAEFAGGIPASARPPWNL